MRHAYLETVHALRNRALPATNVGTRVRLSKTPEAYAASRATHPEPQYEALLAAGRTKWFPGERVRFYRTKNKTYAWLPEEAEEAPAGTTWEDESSLRNVVAGLAPAIEDSSHEALADRRDYDVDHYLQVLVSSYAARLRKAFSPDDFEQLFRLEDQPSLFDRPIESISPRWIRCQV